ncbi:MAG: hypothetical protein JXA42_15415 [Anaerolineales bacterium]|nr:hypothetical protein [Anaerolineales bacterium]
MTDRETILLNFSTCTRCGHFLATCLSVHKTTPDQVLTGPDDPWLIFDWHPAIGEALITYFDLDFKPDLDRHTGLCPTCQRLLIYERHQDSASLKLEIQPGSHVDESGQQDQD